jgi:hypothetical protein
MHLQALDSLISSIHGFEGDSPVPVVLILAQTLSVESVGDSSTGPSVESSRTRAGKCKAIATPPPPKKPRKVVSKKASGVKVNDLSPKPSPDPTPPKCTQGRFTMRQSNTYL